MYIYRIQSSRIMTYSHPSTHTNTTSLPLSPSQPRLRPYMYTDTYIRKQIYVQLRCGANGRLLLGYLPACYIVNLCHTQHRRTHVYICMHTSHL